MPTVDDAAFESAMASEVERRQLLAGLLARGMDGRGVDTSAASVGPAGFRAQTYGHGRHRPGKQRGRAADR